MKLLAVDGNSIINRAFYGIKMLTTKSGIYTNGIYGFMTILGRLIDAESPDGVAVAFDLHAPTFRHLKYSGYKAGRKPMPDELRSQIPLLKKLLSLYGYKCIEKEGYEADDILGTLARICETTGNNCVIATGDRDSFQLISNSTKVVLSSTKMGKPEIINYTPEVIFEKYGVRPQQMVEIKALQGDASDKIPGVAGVGEKTADELIKAFGDIDYIYKNIDFLDIKETLRAKLIAGKDSAYLSRFLGTICREVPVDEDIESYRTGSVNVKELSEMLTELEFFSMLEKMGLKASSKTEKKEKVNFEISDTEAVLGAASSAGVCDIYYKDGCLNIFAEGLAAAVTLFDAADILAKDSIKLRIYDSKPLYKACIENDIAISGVIFDTCLAAYLLDPSSSNYEIGRLCVENGVSLPETDAIDDIKNVAMLSPLNTVLIAKCEEKGTAKLLSQIEIPLARVLAEMEEEGFLVDRGKISEYGKSLAVRISELENSVKAAVGYDFNLNSPKQLGTALFEALGLPCKKKTKSGYSTNADVLESLKGFHPAVAELLEYRTLSKLKSTYCDGLTAVVAADGRIHSTLNQTETRTGRISSSEPNLQNIPVRRPEGRELRRFFTAKEGFVLCDADYSQIELRVLAHIAHDKNMTDAFIKGTDIHTLTASQVFGMPVGMVTPLMRSRAKAVNFGIVYGIGAYSLAKDIGVTNKEAAAYINGYLATYPQVNEYMHRVVEQAKADGYATTMFGRIRLLPELKNSNGMMRAFGERVARNMPIQGTAADIIKIAMIRVSNRLHREIPNAKLIMQVHDELIVEAPEAEAERVCNVLCEEMENAVSLDVPLVADAHYGKTWYDAKG